MTSGKKTCVLGAIFSIFGAFWPQPGSQKSPQIGKMPATNACTKMPKTNQVAAEEGGSFGRTKMRPGLPRIFIVNDDWTTVRRRHRKVIRGRITEMPPIETKEIQPWAWFDKRKLPEVRLLMEGDGNGDALMQLSGDRAAVPNRMMWLHVTTDIRKAPALLH